MQRRLVGAAIFDGDADQNIVRRAFRILGEHVEVAALVEHSRIGQIKLGRAKSAPTVFLDEPRLRIFRLRVLVERLHVAMRRRRIQVEVAFLHVLASEPVSPKSRSFKIGSLLFQSANAKQSRHCRSVMPSRPSSPQRYARLRA